MNTSLQLLSSTHSVSLSGSILEISKNERFKKAGKAWAMCWGMALATAFIPLVHLLVTPILILSGPVVFFVIFRQEKILEPLDFDCPECSGKIEMKKRAASFPIEVTCPGCRYSYKLQPAEEEK